MTPGMTPKAKQILEYLHEKLPDMLFAWKEENDIWFLGDSNPCTLVVSFRANPDVKEILPYTTGIENRSPENIACYDIPRIRTSLSKK